MKYDLKKETENVKKKLNYIARLIISTYEENNIGDDSYKLNQANKLLATNTKFDSLFELYNLDKRNKKTFAHKLGVKSYNDFEVFMRVLQLV